MSACLFGHQVEVAFGETMMLAFLVEDDSQAAEHADAFAAIPDGSLTLLSELFGSDHGQELTHCPPRSA
jgi:hypothetical protein